MFHGEYNGKKIHPSDLAQVLCRAWKAGLTEIILTGGSLLESIEALSIARTDGVKLKITQTDYIAP